MLSKDRISLETLEESTFSQPWLLKQESTEILPNLTCHIGSGSGGYSDYIFKFAAKELFGIEGINLQYKTLRFFFKPTIYYKLNLYVVETKILKK